MAKYRRRARRERITIQSPVKTETDYGHQKTTSYANVTDLVSLHADWTHIGGTETFRGRQVEATVTGVFEIRMPRVAVDPKWRVVHTNKGNAVYEIVSARPAEGEFEGGDRTMWIFVKGLA